MGTIVCNIFCIVIIIFGLVAMEWLFKHDISDLKYIFSKDNIPENIPDEKKPITPTYYYTEEEEERNRHHRRGNNIVRFTKKF